ncbi:aldo/keto reductase [Klebsiella variicola subsp. variicola]|nr:aldo/keto reductase [Klebsiella variicola subsp. variicola]
MHHIARAHHASVAQVAIAWLLSKKAVTSVLLGSSKREQLDSNLHAAELQLTPEELSGLDSLTALTPLYP